MSYLIPNSTPAQRKRGQSFGEKFQSAARVALNRGTVSGTPGFDFGGEFDGVGDKVVYPIVRSVKSVSFWIALDSTTEDVIKLSAAHSVTVSGGTLSATGFTAPTILINGVATSTITTAKSFVTITTATAFDADDFQVGFVAGFGGFWIDDLQLWTNEQSAAEHSDFYTHSTYNYRNKAVGDWPMLDAQDDPGVKTLDVSGSGANAVFGAGAAEPTKVVGQRGYSTDGGDHMVAPNIASSLPAVTSIVAFQLGTNANGQTVSSYDKTDLTKIGFMNFYTAGEYRFFCGNAAANSAAKFPFSNPAGHLAIVVGTYDGTDTCIWVNGIRGTDGLVPVAPSVDSSSVMTFFKRGNFASPASSGTIVYEQIVLPFAMTPIQVYDITGKIKRSINRV